MGTYKKLPLIYDSDANEIIIFQVEISFVSLHEKGGLLVCLFHSFLQYAMNKIISFIFHRKIKSMYIAYAIENISFVDLIAVKYTNIKKWHENLHCPSQ